MLKTTSPGEKRPKPKMAVVTRIFNSGVLPPGIMGLFQTGFCMLIAVLSASKAIVSKGPMI